MLGKTISHYQILEKLGGGGMGVVYKARDTLLGRMVALKVVTPDLLKDPEALSGFVREAKAASALNHPNILTVHDLVEAEGAHFLVMELVEGQTLRQCIGKKGMETRQLLKAAIQVAEALAAAHRAGIVHRDLKPENIMMRSDEQVKVVDFGLAKLLDRNIADRANTASAEATVPLDEAIRQGQRGKGEKSHVAGTLPYMSPEQLSGTTVDQHTDIFSFGVVVYEMVTGQQPFQGPTTREIVDQIREKDPVPVTDLSPAVPEKIQEIVSKCLEKDPADRYQHVDDIVVDLRKIKRLTESGPKPPFPTRRGPGKTEQPAQRRSAAIAIAIVASVLLVLGFGLLVQRLRHKPDVGIVLKWGEEIGNAVLSPKGDLIAFDSGVTGQREIYVMQTEGGSAKQITQGPGDKFDPRFSRNGTQLLYAVQTGGNEIWTISTLGMNAQKLIASANSADWSPDDKQVVYARRLTGEPASLVIANESGGSDHTIYTSRFEKITQVRWSPDNQWIFFVDDEGAMLIAPGGGQAKKLEQIPENVGDVVWALRGQYLLYSNRLNGITNIWRLKVPDGEPERVTSGPGDDFDPMPNLVDREFIYAHGRKERDLWLAAVNGKESRKLVRGGWVSGPTISSDGKKIAFIGEEADGTEYLGAIGSDGQSPAKLTRQGPSQYLSLPVWSSDGTRLAYSALIKEPSEYWHVFFVDSADKTPKQLTQGAFDAYVDGWYPDGKRIVYEKVVEGKSLLMDLELATGKDSQIENDLEGGKYSSNGKWLLALSATSKPEQEGLWILPAKGGARVRAIARYVSYAKWALRDHAIIYSSSGKTKGKINLWKLPIQEGKPAGSPAIFFSFPATTYADNEWDIGDDLAWVVYPHTDSRADFYKMLPPK